MPEPSGDTPRPPPAIPPESAGKNLTVAPRANPPSVFNQKSPTPAVLPAGMAEFMDWMRKFAGGSPLPEEGAPAGRTLIPKEQKKFSRQAPESSRTAPASSGAALVARSGSEGEASANPPGSGQDAGIGDAPGRPAPPEPTAEDRRRRSKERPPKSPAVVLSIQFLVFGFIVGSFFLGRATVSRQSGSAKLDSGTNTTVSDQGVPVTLPAGLAAKIDLANAEEKSGNFAHARVLLEEVQRAGGHVEGLDYHLALLAYESGDAPRALILLNTVTTQPGEAADAYNLRGIMMEHAAGLGKGLPDLERAAQFEPFNARHAYYVGEVFRRMGKPQAALDYLTQALHRLREPSLQGIYEAKLRLAQLEAGQEQAFSGELASQLTLDPPSVDWLFTAAAVELHRGNAAAAAGYLDKARAATSREDMASHLRDYYFSSFANDRELTRFFHPTDQPAAASVLPTVSSTPPGPAVAPAGQEKLP